MFFNFHLELFKLMTWVNYHLTRINILLLMNERINIIPIPLSFFVPRSSIILHFPNPFFRSIHSRTKSKLILASKNIFPNDFRPPINPKTRVNRVFSSPTPWQWNQLSRLIPSSRFGISISLSTLATISLKTRHVRQLDCPPGHAKICVNRFDSLSSRASLK